MKIYKFRIFHDYRSQIHNLTNETFDALPTFLTDFLVVEKVKEKNENFFVRHLRKTEIG